MVLIAGSLGAVLYLVFRLSISEATIVALAALTALAIYGTVTARERDRTDLGTQIADLSRGTADLAQQVAELGRRTAALEAHGDKVADSAAAKARAIGEPLAAELGELGALVKQLAETVAMHELKLVEVGKANADRRPYEGRLSAVAAAAAADLEARGPEPKPQVAPAEDDDDGSPRDDMIEIVRSAIDDNRVDLYLQPTVTLPQRKVRYYEAFTRLRTEDGAVLTPAAFLDAAEAGGLMPRIDNLLLFRSVQVVRRLQLKNREIGLFCNIASSTLNHPEIFPQLLQFMDANRALAPALVLELPQRVLHAMGPLETESLAALRDLGFRFCIDQVTDLRMEPRDLGERGIRYVKVPAALLLGQASVSNSDIHAADLSDLLGRFGISLIAERIETEAQVVDLLEYDVRFGQGFLFSQPRPVRPEALRGSAQGATGTARDTAEPARERVAASGSAGFAL
jgi:cyclic-di-GMP phosphodiesterase TipF (flagellum assembly factor)